MDSDNVVETLRAVATGLSPKWKAKYVEVILTNSKSEIIEYLIRTRTMTI